MNIDVSIIIPVYEVQDYIQNCLESVASQTYKGSIECVLIDDCGKDQSVNIATEFITRNDSSVSFRFVHHQNNRGLSAARNTGIQESKGKWLFFLDSDDWISQNCIEIMMQRIQLNPSLDMVIGNYNYIGKQLDLKFAPAGIYTEDFINMAHFGLMYPMIPNKLVAKSFITDNRLFFEEGVLHEDVLWTLQASCYLHKIEFIAEKTYNYVIHSGSISTKESFDFHYKHWSSVKLLSIHFAFSRGLENNIDLYKFCTDNLYEFVLEPIQQNKINLAKDFYCKLRSTEFWSLLFIIHHRRSWKEVAISINRYLPIRLGFFFLRHILPAYKII